jgi:hypothetical protein
MFRRLMHVLIAFIVAMAATMPVGVRAMPMSPAGTGMGDQPCQNCPQPNQTGTSPDKMAPCQAFACANVVATLPTPAPIRVRVQFDVAYVQPPSARWTEATRAPDPFPPRPIVLL